MVQEAGWAPGPVWTGAENLAPTGIRSSDNGNTVLLRKSDNWAKRYRIQEDHNINLQSLQTLTSNRILIYHFI